MTYPHDYQRDYDRNRQIDRQTAEYEAAGMLPLVGILGALVLGVVVYSYAFKGETTQTASQSPSTMEKVERPAAAPRAPAETTGSGAQR